MARLLRLLPLLILIAGAALAWTFGLAHGLSWRGLASREATLRALAAAHPFLAPLAFAGIYAAVTALSIPEASLLSIAGGTLFGTAMGALSVEIGATAGAVLLFLAARTALTEPMRRRAGPFLERIRPGLERDGFSYLLSLRLLPIFPFWLVNLAAAVVGMRLAPFALATAIGIVPGVVLFVSIGAGLGDVLALGSQPDLSALLSWRSIASRFGLAGLALVPVFWRRYRRSHG